MVRVILVLALLAVGLPATAQDDLREPMTLDRIDDLIGAIGDEVKRSDDGTVWQFFVIDWPVTVVTDVANDRMRNLVPIHYAEQIDPAIMFRALQANFDATLDARYAIAQGLVWSTYIHPLSPLTDDQFLSGTGQTVHLA